MIPSLAIVDIGSKHQLTGRAAAIVALIVCYEERINAMRTGQLQLHCGAGGEVRLCLVDWLEGKAG